MFRKLLLLCVLASLCGAASAAPKEKGFYLGAAGGLSLYDDDGAFGPGLDDEDNAFQVHAGYKFFPYVAVEARHADFGSFDLGFVNATVDFSVTTVQAVGMFPFGDSGWEIFGSLGLGSLGIGGQAGGGIDDGSVFGGGFGVRYYATPNFSIGVQTDAYVWEDSGLFDMAIGGTQLSINFIF